LTGEAAEKPAAWAGATAGTAATVVAGRQV
jgi:hypothetical protein